jgi:hypothetical protein
MAVLSESERTTILFAAQVIDAYGHGKRRSQAADDLRTLLASSPQPFSRGLSYAELVDRVRDNVGEADE